MATRTPVQPRRFENVCFAALDSDAINGGCFIKDPNLGMAVVEIRTR